ncbi:MAG TPA: porin [Burkholderiaceae bacterium]|nr:porin [Burkholderiaceae bacterium]
MKKISAALGAVACAVGAAASAQSSVTVSGLVDLGISTGKDAAGVTQRTTQMLSSGLTTSYLQFAGTEDLGGGLSAGFTLGTFFQPNNGVDGRFTGDTLFSRDASVNLAGGFGKVVIGRQIDPAFLPTILFNPFADSFDYSPLVFHTYLSGGGYNAPLYFTDSGYSNAVSYTSPSLGGATISAAYQIGGIAGQTKQNDGINVLYFGGPLALTAFIESNELSNPVPSLLQATPFPAAAYSKVTFYGAGASYDLSVVKFYANIEGAKYTGFTGSGSDKDKIYNLGLSVPLAGGSIMLDGAQTKLATGWTGTLSGAKWTTYALGYDYPLSKRTDVYVVDKDEKFTGLASANQFGVGIRHKF